MTITDQLSVQGFAAVDMATAATQGFRDGVASCRCAMTTCVEPWEPGCGLGNDPAHARIVAMSVDRAVKESLTVSDDSCLRGLPPLPAPGCEARDEGADGLQSWPANPDYYTAGQMRNYARAAIAALQQPSAQEAVAWIDRDGSVTKSPAWIKRYPLLWKPLYAAPTLRPITDEDMDAAIDAYMDELTDGSLWSSMRAALESLLPHGVPVVPEVSNG